ncbi:hypothetical protein [Paenibacillus cremeus]|uniref:Uncharacterized protein n=1 Tax=Paenibacillus cremeus TaxID=2163881 RepID=A0A559K457_9BACL|nr:hypothetical protein [Paenibacillus cremeus]TVY06912.1 hypothetical protein FPZ49_26725 [Paenibacillus cremeus]
MIEEKPERPVELCPHCGADLIGDPIPEEKRRHANSPYFIKRRIGLYDLKLDRTTHWQCPDCEGTWERHD